MLFTAAMIDTKIGKQTDNQDVANDATLDSSSMSLDSTFNLNSFLGTAPVHSRDKYTAQNDADLRLINLKRDVGVPIHSLSQNAALKKTPSLFVLKGTVAWDGFFLV